MKWLKRILIVLAVLLVSAVALPFFIPLDDYIPRIEKEVSARLKEPVSIKSIRFTALPLPHVRVESIRLNNVLVDLGRASFGPFDARVSLDGNGDPESASIATQDGKLKALIRPDRSKYLIDASAKSWTLPVWPALVFDELTIKGVATLDAPLLYPTAATMAGAAVGTVILGPGLGTSVGAKIGGWAEGLFGGKEQKK